MPENDDTQVMPPTDEGVEPPEGGSAATAGESSSRSAVPRRWFVAAVIAVLLLAAGVGVYLGMSGTDEPQVGDVAGADQVTVPDLRGMTLERAVQDAEAVGLSVDETATAVVDESVAPAGTVLSQEPLPGAEVPAGSAVSLVIAQAPAVAQPPAEASAGTSGGTSAAAEPPPAPGNVEIADASQLIAVPKAIDLEILQIQQWTTVLEHSDLAQQWTSGAVTLGGGDKRILLTADGPNGYLVAVWSWDAANDTDWHLESVVVSAPGSSAYETVLDSPAGNHTFLVKSQDTSVHWTLQVQEK